MLPRRAEFHPGVEKDIPMQQPCRSPAEKRRVLSAGPEPELVQQEASSADQRGCVLSSWLCSELPAAVQPGAPLQAKGNIRPVRFGVTVRYRLNLSRTKDGLAFPEELCEPPPVHSRRGRNPLGDPVAEGKE